MRVCRRGDGVLGAGGTTCTPQAPSRLCLPEPRPQGTLLGSTVTGQDLLHGMLMLVSSTYTVPGVHTCITHIHCEYKLAHVHTATQGRAYSYAQRSHSMSIPTHSHLKRTPGHSHTSVHTQYTLIQLYMHTYTQKHIPQRDKASGGVGGFPLKRTLVRQKSPGIWRPEPSQARCLELGGLAAFFWQKDLVLSRT